MDIVSGRSLSGGSFRHTLQYPPPQLCFSFSGSFGSRLQCLISSMGRLGLPLLVPSGTSPPSDSASPLQVQGQRGLNSSLLCSIRLVHSSSPQISEPSSSSGLPLVSGHQPRAGFPQQPSRFFPSCVETVRRSLLGSCFSDQTISILCLAHKPSTTSQYQSVWSLFLNFLADRGLTSLDMTEVSCVGIVCDFLAYHSSLGKQYRTIASYRSALRHPILFTCGVDIRSEASDLFMRGLFNFHPPVRSRPMPLWSLASLLDFLCGPPFEPLESASFRALIRKTLSSTSCHGQTHR
ncbi:unnamed protein product [Meganyctiphanes norvegica]|uniref:Core-binding (CB) domain-containing protein n=1 Tax=Meganyctiphanes norvegica TaxID=48144 RepID=A0AAV2QDL6_MEGNR